QGALEGRALAPQARGLRPSAPGTEHECARELGSHVVAQRRPLPIALTSRPPSYARSPIQPASGLWWNRLQIWQSVPAHPL
ncbi:hypothetical protein ABTK02_22480, partial [Acinetobacter baumannii]